MSKSGMYVKCARFSVLVMLCFIMVDMFRVLNIDHINCQLMVGDESGTLGLGTYGYCIQVIDNKTCTVGLLHDTDIRTKIGMSEFHAMAPFISKYIAIGIVIIAVFFPVLRNAKYLALVTAVSIAFGAGTYGVFIWKQSQWCEISSGFALPCLCIVIFSFFAGAKKCDKWSAEREKLREEEKKKSEEDRRRRFEGSEAEKKLEASKVKDLETDSVIDFK